MSRTALDVIQVISPCHESWDAMAGDDATRFCAGCQRHVYNLAAMRRTDAERLVCERAGSLCIRFERMPDSLVRTLDYHASKGVRRSWRFWTLVGALGGVLAGTVHAVVSGKGLSVVPPPTPPSVVMGGCPAPPVSQSAPSSS